MRRATAALSGRNRIVVLTGAGVSTDSGIPDYRGPRGAWTGDPDAQRFARIPDYLDDPELRVRAWQRRLASPAWRARPNPGHVALVELERSGRLGVLVTQNIDGLHLAAGHDPGLVIEAHGRSPWRSASRARGRRRCAGCWIASRAGEPDPRCPACAGVLKSATVYFGEPLDAARLDRAMAAAESADVLVAVGTSLKVRPIANMVPRALAAGVPVVIVNAEPTPWDHRATAVVRGSISEVLPALLAEQPAAGRSPRRSRGWRWRRGTAR